MRPEWHQSQTDDFTTEDTRIGSLVDRIRGESGPMMSRM
jgi:hypothetical protein